VVVPVGVVPVAVVSVPGVSVPVVVDPGAAAPIAPGGTTGVPGGSPRRFGYVVGLEQQALGSAYWPVCGAWSNVIAIRPSSLYAGDFLISGTTVFRNWLAPASPGVAFGLNGAS